MKMVVGVVAGWIAVACFLGFQIGLSGTAAAQEAVDAGSMKHPFRLRIEAPPLDGGVEWVNTAGPIKLADLRGRFVLLDFWTFCCINCMQELPEIKKLEDAFPNELVVIGVHSAKFEGEQDTENIREATARYEIEHPVVNDANMAIWRNYGARSWPTLVLIDPAGEVVWAASGERPFEEMKAVIDRGLPYYRAQKLLVPAPRPAVFAGKKRKATPLRYPAKLLVDTKGGRLFISDSNHHRVVVTNLDGQFQFAVGSGAIGRADGSFEAASFHRPQGMALVGDALYLADTENHLLRKIDLQTRQVSTVAGTGEKGNALFGVAKPLETPLASPWACWPKGDHLYIAMAGPHQIWKLTPGADRLELFAGNGREDIVDGPLLPPSLGEFGYASLAQPSGLTSDGERLFVADSEGSTVRAMPFDPAGSAQTLVGLTGTLFDFGDVDGQGQAVRLQHPLDVAWANGQLYVADTYNNKIKVIDVDKRTCRTIAGTGKPGSADGDGAAATFNEPGGISAADGKLYVADTNNHAIRVVELAAPFRVTTVKIEGVTPPAEKAAK